MIREDIVEKMELSVDSGYVNVRTIKDVELMKLSKVALSVSDRSRKEIMQIKAAHAVSAYRFNMPSRPCLEYFRDSDVYTHLDGLEFGSVDPDEITVLIGSDVPEAQLHVETRRGNRGQPLAIKTIFGWTLFGNALSHGGVEPSTSAVLCTSAEVLNASLERLWEDHIPTVSINLLTTREDQTLNSMLERHWK